MKEALNFNCLSQTNPPRKYTIKMFRKVSLSALVLAGLANAQNATNGTAAASGAASLASQNSNLLIMTLGYCAAAVLVSAITI